jgi:hypothetical protein
MMQMRLERPTKPTSNAARATLDRDEAIAAGGVPTGRVCEIEGDEIVVKITPASLEYLERIAGKDRARQLLRAIPFCEANDRPRVESHHFAMAQGARTHDEIDAWHTRNGVRSRSTKPPTLEVPND